MFKTRAGRSEVSNGVVLSKVRVNPALKAIAYGRAITDFVEFTGVFVTTATLAGKGRHWTLRGGR
jgi:hypothetical protein